MHEPFHTLRRVDLPLPQNGMDKAVSQAVPVLHAVVAARHRVTSHQRMIDDLLVVAVVGSAGLMANCPLVASDSVSADGLNEVP